MKNMDLFSHFEASPWFNGQTVQTCLQPEKFGLHACAFREMGSVLYNGGRTKEQNSDKWAGLHKVKYIK